MRRGRLRPFRGRGTPCGLVLDHENMEIDAKIACLDHGYEHPDACGLREVKFIN